MCAPPISVHTESSTANTGAQSKTIWKTQTAYCRKTLNAALTLKVFDFTLWKDYCAPWNWIY